MKHYHNSNMGVSESAHADAPKGWDKVWSDGFIKLEQQRAPGYRFRVTYGLEVWDELTYEQATSKVGEALFHQLACDSKLDNNGV
jgi:hypothetical protein